MQVFRSSVLNVGILSLVMVSCMKGQTTGHFGVEQAKTEPSATPLTAADPSQVPTLPSSGEHRLEKADLEAFFDGILPLQLERNDIAGASVLVMKDGEVLLQKGYGYADEKSHKPVNPDSTIFRLASISKLFTWVSVMQLQEQGKLDLDADINRYLDFQIRPAFGKPITLRNLMTHTGGFEDTDNDVIFTSPSRVLALRDYLVRNQPERIFPPGEVPAYSNYGVGLASYIVQRVSGERFEAYVQGHIFGPLKMVHSTFYQPPQRAMASLPSEGYRDDTTKPPVGFEVFNPVGAGGLSSTASDMGRFGQALLKGGMLDDQRILKPETLVSMWTPQFRASPQLPPQCMGFYQVWRDNLRWIGHEGDLIAFHSLFFVEPKEKLVFFVSYNSAGGGKQPRTEMIDFFSDRYFPAASAPKFVKVPVSDLKAIEGSYQMTRREQSTKEALGNLFAQFTASVDKEGVLTVNRVKDLRGHATKWKPVGKDLWYEEEGQQTIFGIRDATNRIVRVAVDFPGVQLERVAWYENAKWVLPSTALSLVILFTVTFASLVRTGRRVFFRERPRIVARPGTVWLSWGSRAACFQWVGLFACLVGFFAATGDDLMLRTPAWFPWLVLVNVATGVALLLTLFAVVSGINVWFRDGLRTITRVKFSFVALACLMLSWFSIHWHLIGPAHRL